MERTGSHCKLRTVASSGLRPLSICVKLLSTANYGIDSRHEAAGRRRAVSEEGSCRWRKVAPVASLNTVSVTWDEQDRPVITVQYADGAAGAAAIDTDAWLRTFADRLPDKSAKYLSALIEVNETDGHVTFADLATHLGEEKKEIEGWNRNLGRSIKAVVRELGFLRSDRDDGTAQLFDIEWREEANMWAYAVPTKFRATLVTALEGS